MARNMESSSGSHGEAGKATQAGLEWVGLHDAAKILGQCPQTLRHVCGLAWEGLGLARKVSTGVGRAGWQIRSDANPILAAAFGAGRAKLIAEWDGVCEAAVAKATGEYLAGLRARGIKIGSDMLRRWKAELIEGAKMGTSKTA